MEIDSELPHLIKRLFLFLASFPFLFFLAVSHANTLVAPKKNLENGARFEPTKCWFSSNILTLDSQSIRWGNGGLKRIECGYFFTRKEQNKSYFRLPIVIIRNSFWHNSEKPILNISGGPGGSTWLEKEGITNFWLPFLESADWQHDMVLFDARGAGLSKPALHCKNLIKDSIAILTKNLTPEEEAKYNHKLANNCYQNLSDNQAHLNALHHLGTYRSADDLADLADLLNIDSWHLYGTSYGTRLALEVARRHPDKVASLILDSVYPQEFDGDETLAKLYLESIERIFKACENDPDCSKSYSDLNKKFHDLLQRLQKKPITLSLSVKNKTIDYILTPTRLFSIFFDASYGIDAIALIPKAVQTLHENKRQAINYLAQSSLELLLDDSFSSPVFMEIECNENEIKDQKIHIQNIINTYKNYPVIKRWQLAYFKEDICKPWGSKEVNSNFNLPVNSDKPTLIFAGRFDSVTPPSWGKALSKHLPNSQYHEFYASGHAVLYDVDCAKKIVRNFLNPQKKYPPACKSTNGIYDSTIHWASPDDY